MALFMNTFFIFSLFLPLLLPSLVSCADSQVYIVYFGEHEHSKGGDEITINKEELDNEIEERHHSYLKRVKETEEEARSSLIYSYKNSINGFAATLTPHQASLFSEMKEVASVIPSHPKMYSLHTTRSWEFAGLKFPTNHHMNKEEKKDRDLLLKAKYGKDIIIGLLDSGVWPESTSFNDVGMGDIPKHWKGTCQTGDAFNSTHCNKKLIGARFYLKGFEKYFGPLNTTLDYKSPRDRAGHGTHTSSIAAGRKVHGVSALGGFAQGTASGAMPHTRVAMYKVCWSVPRKEEYLSFGCWPEDLLAAIDDAIADGVNVLSISIGTSISIGSSISIQSMLPFDYKDDAIAIGALHATKKNIVVSCSAGNNGPHPGTLSNMAPWIITVGASSIDWDFLGPVLLGNGMTIEGVSASPHQLEKMYPLIYAAEAVNPDVPKNDTAGQCLPGSLSPKEAKGKIVVCLSGNGGSVAKGAEVKRAGGVGLILGNTEENTFGVMADSHFLPATSVNSTYLSMILEYINSTKNAMAQIELAETVLHTRPAPYMASFSSRGPNIVTPDILKPDITAPGINILAAWSEEASPTMLKADERVVKYNILSGTSMACPHVAGAAALLRAIHPSWSSAAIRSALITSAGLRNNEGDLITDYLGQPADPFQFGSGHFRPTRAVDPGLIYNASYTDYLLFLCKNPGPNAFEKSFNCTRNSTQAYNLNYPSLAISKFSINDTLTINRTVTNVGGGKSVYFASVKPPLGISVKVSPSILHFHKVGEEKSFTLTVKADREMVGMIDRTDNTTFGWYKWNDGIHSVRSPIAVTLVY